MIESGTGPKGKRGPKIQEQGAEGQVPESSCTARKRYLRAFDDEALAVKIVQLA